MKKFKTRRIFKSATTTQTEVKDLLQGIFIGELVSPSKSLWLVSPWISDIEILNNLSGLFSTLDPFWGKRPIRLVEIIVKILSLGSNVVIATRPDAHNSIFLSKLNERVGDIGAIDRLTIRKKEHLHIKGVLGGHYFLSGSMNITFNGIEILEEQITFEIDKSAIGDAKLAFYENYGGIL